MLEGNSASRLPTILKVNSIKSFSASNFATVVNHSQLLIDTVSNYSESDTSVPPVKGKSPNGSIYVCTFCQVFSSSQSSLIDHITSTHQDSLLDGTTAINFVSKLQALENHKTSPKKVGRKRKETVVSVNDEKKEACPVPDSDGLYWCSKCHKSFKKMRQYTQHVCLEIDSEDELSNDSAIDSDESEFRSYLDIEQPPWSRNPRKRNNAAKSLTANQYPIKDKIQNGYVMEFSSDNQPAKEKRNWREDPDYSPLFQNERAKQAFENHLRSIDCSFVDNLYIKKESKIRNKKKSRQPQNIFVYSCVVCQKVFKSVTHIRMHCMTHTDMKPFTCPQCPYSTNTKGSLYSHMRHHTGNLFRCSKCDFKATRRAHLVEHEETHSTVAKICKLCNNSYKTVKSLISHVLRYHNYPEGKKYAKSLSSKKPQDTRQKRLKSHSELPNSKQIGHPEPCSQVTVEIGTVCGELLFTAAHSQISSTPEVDERYPSENSLADIVLNDLLQQKVEAPIEIYDDVFQACLPDNSLLTPPECPATNKEQQPLVDVAVQCLPPNDVLSECQKSDLDILGECLRESNFPDGMIAKPNVASLELPAACGPTFGLHSMQLPFRNESLVADSISESVSELPAHLGSELIEKSGLVEAKSEEIKLFEKCRRAPAYVCCVCQGIFICPLTLRAHLKVHISSNSSLVEQGEASYDQPIIPECESDIDKVCKILQDTTESAMSGEEELEKLYSSSLDMLFYLPEVSVVLENDPSLASVLEELSNFPIKYDDDLETSCGDMF